MICLKKTTVIAAEVEAGEVEAAIKEVVVAQILRQGR